MGITNILLLLICLHSAYCQEDDPCCPDPWVAATTASTIRSEPPPQAQASADINIVQGTIQGIDPTIIAAAQKCAKELFTGVPDDGTYVNNLKYSLSLFGDNASVVFDFDSDINENQTKVFEVVADKIQNGTGTDPKPDLAAGLRAACEIFGGPSDRIGVPNVVFIFISNDTTSNDLAELKAAGECLRNKSQLVILTLGEVSKELKNSPILKTIAGSDGTILTCKEFIRRDIFRREFIDKKIVRVFNGPRTIGVCKSKLDVVLLPNIVYKYGKRKESMGIQMVIDSIIDAPVTKSDTELDQTYEKINDLFRYGVVTFKNQGKTEINFDDELNKNKTSQKEIEIGLLELKNAIGDILNKGTVMQEGGANFVAGLQEAEKLLKSSSNRETAPNVVFFITTNDDNFSELSLKAVAAKLKGRTRVIVVTVGKDAMKLKNSDILKVIASAKDVITSSELKKKILKILSEQSLTVCQFIEVPGANVDGFRAKRQLPEFPPERECEIFLGDKEPIRYGSGNVRVMYKDLWHFGKEAYKLCKKTKPLNHACQGIIQAVNNKANRMMIETINLRDEFFNAEFGQRQLVKNRLTKIKRFWSEAKRNYELTVFELFSSGPQPDNPCYKELTSINDTINQLGQLQESVGRCTGKSRKRCIDRDAVTTAQQQNIITTVPTTQPLKP